MARVLAAALALGALRASASVITYVPDEGFSGLDEVVLSVSVPATRASTLPPEDDDSE